MVKTAMSSKSVKREKDNKRGNLPTLKKGLIWQTGLVTLLH
jgi:hypothetical protein